MLGYLRQLRDGFFANVTCRIYPLLLGPSFDHVFKSHITGKLHGTVIDLGGGDGRNLFDSLTVPHHGIGRSRRQLLLPADVDKWISIDPNPSLCERLRATAASLDVVNARGRKVDVTVYCTGGERMSELACESVDCVLSVHVLCSIPSSVIPKVFTEVARVLKPGGCYVFLDHVVADPSRWLGWAQMSIHWIWTAFGGGCRFLPLWEEYDRLKALKFQVSYERFDLGPRGPYLFMYFAKPHLKGVAVKRIGT